MYKHQYEYNNLTSTTSRLHCIQNIFSDSHNDDYNDAAKWYILKQELWFNFNIISVKDF